MFSDELRANAERLLAAARAKGLKIATAESCTGGLIAGLLTEIAGSSDVFERGFVTYSNEAKETMLGVPGALLRQHGALLRQHGAVSQSVARAMAEGAIRNSLAQVSVAVTGIAGPGGGTGEKPVGTVFIALAKNGKPAACTRIQIPGDRETFKRLATQSALDILRRELLQTR